MDDYGHYCRPGLTRMLHALSLDAVYERAEGDRLWQKKGDELVEVLDLVGGFGANLFGHYHPELVAEDRRLAEIKVPILAQGSCRQGAALLAKALSDRLGDYICIFTNSGAETVEAALKHAYLERGRPIYWALERAFHGKTLGAIQLTPAYREPFSLFGPQVRFLNPLDPSTWAEAEAEVDQVSAAYIEPVQGEGGINVLPQDFVDWLTSVCRRNRIPLVVDEIQSGMGRTGQFLASQSMGVMPDYLCLSKSLGGGLAKIGALLIKRERFIDEFSVKHTSTFAEDDRSCLIALKALEILERDNLPGRCQALGEHLKDKLEDLRKRFPDHIRDVRGLGLMVGIELQDLSDSPSSTLRMLSQQDYLGYLATAYLLNVHRIRIAPALSQPSTIRIEPSAYISTTDLDTFVTAFSRFCEALEALDIRHLTAYQVDRPSGLIANYNEPRPFKREAPRTPKRVAFLGHLILPEHAPLWDPSLRAFAPGDLEAYMARPSRILGPTVFDQINVQSRTGDEVHLKYIALDLTPGQILKSMRTRDTRWITDKIEESVEMAREEGCSVIGLGAYTSIISGNCQRVKTNGIALTSGNSLTVGMGIKALKRSAETAGINLSSARMGIVGATGNIATTYAIMMGPELAELVLIVRDANSPRLQSVVEQIKEAAPAVRITVVADLAALRDCSLIVTASNTAEPLLHPEHVANEPVVICDISVPSDVSPEMSTKRPNAIVIHGGIVRLPHNEDFIIGGLPLERGHVYACMAETLLMGLEGINSHGSYGPVRADGVFRALSMAEKHGFVLADVASGWTY
ncbi:MAG TPA: aminotransferase class III-fold pyridoxal phosphate-dependent enzyme [Pyrinomonadaceae bacterium]